ncbi:hypothetical protein [Paraliomyxa miuraensis]|uniref:hypothetical protein n=1 Tax=Paraliomyxa miuraensis TaxID=376150 RepID=UPI0022536603|nr:hypothetical protein [Paraliomyxa miuraensis]MCX4241907.1 hypothetical protein [Paraliomyxa miuraensis]
MSLVALAFALVIGSCTCSDRPLGDPPADRVEPACLWLISPYAELADGGTHLIYDEPHHRSGTVCLCLTQDEFDGLGDRYERVGWPEEGTLLEEYNELAYEECKRLSALIEDVVDDECLEYYEAGDWLDDIYFARGDWAIGAPPGFTCDDP